MQPLKFLVTGAAGFIGSTLVDRLLANGFTVVGFDNLSTGQMEFLRGALQSPAFRLIQGDLLDRAALDTAMAGVDTVFHLAANADVRFGTQHPTRDLEQNTIGTANVLEAARLAGVRRFAFSSTGSVYGEPSVFPTPEHAPFPVQTSLYGASKLAAEGMIAAYAEGFGIQGFIFRFVSILGERYTHGHIFDFYRQLLEHPGHLRVLGDGKQQKSYLYVQDCIDAILLALEKSTGRINIYNLGAGEFALVNDSIGWITQELNLRPTLEYSGGTRGWVGDSPFIFLDCSKIRALGWAPRLTIREGVVTTLRFLSENQHLLKLR